MASLLENLKKNMTFNIDKGNVEIQKKVAKKKVSSFVGAFTGIHKTETEVDKEIKRRAAVNQDKYREEHNKMFRVDGSRRVGPVVSNNGNGIRNMDKIKQNGKPIEVQATTPDQRYGSRMRVSGNGERQKTKATEDRLSRMKTAPEVSTRPVKGSPGIVTRSKPSEEYGTNRFAAELKRSQQPTNLG